MRAAGVEVDEIGLAAKKFASFAQLMTPCTVLRAKWDRDVVEVAYGGQLEEIAAIAPPDGPDCFPAFLDFRGGVCKGV